MERELSREEFYAALGALSRSVETLSNSMEKSMELGFSQITTRLDKLNGKTERHGEDIAVLKAVQKVAQQVLEDEPRRTTRKDVAVGSGVAAGIIGIIEIIKAYWK